MIPFVLPDINHSELNIFDCISIQKEYFIAPKESPLIDYMVSVYPRNENNSPFSFVYGLFEPKNRAFSNNQDVVLSIAYNLFSESMPLNDFEQKILNKTFLKSIKDKPTLSGRK